MKMNVFVGFWVLLFSWTHVFAADDSLCHYNHLVQVLAQGVSGYREHFKSYVIERGVDVNYIPEDGAVIFGNLVPGNSLLAYATSLLRPEIVGFLLSQNASTEAPLHLAAAVSLRPIEYAFQKFAYEGTKVVGKRVYDLLKLYGARINRSKVKEFSLYFKDGERDSHPLSMHALAFDETIIPELTQNYCYRLLENAENFGGGDIRYKDVCQALTWRCMQEEPKKVSSLLTQALESRQKDLAKVLLKSGVKIVNSGVPLCLLRWHNSEVLECALFQNAIDGKIFSYLLKKAIWASHGSAVEQLKQYYDYADPSENADLLFEALTCPTNQTMVPAVGGYMRAKNVLIDVKKKFPTKDLSQNTVLWHAIEEDFPEEIEWLLAQGAVVTSQFVDLVQEKKRIQPSIKDLIQNAYAQQLAKDSSEQIERRQPSTCVVS